MKITKDSTRDDLIVECARLGRILNEVIQERQGLREEVRQLIDQLGQARAGLELADLIKRMVSCGT